MRLAFRVCLLSAAGLVLPLLARGQQSPSLGDVARQARQQKQQSKGAQSKGGQASRSKVITNDEIPEHPEPATDPAKSSDDEFSGATDSPSVSEGARMSADQWKSQIQEQKNRISSLKQDIERFNNSIHFAPANCVANCVQWNQRQKDKQREVERMRAELQDQVRHLSQMQESARQQGYGNSVYDP